MDTTKTIEIRVPKKISHIDYRVAVRNKLREAGRELDGDMFAIKAYMSILDDCVIIAKEFGVETIWETE